MSVVLIVEDEPILRTAMARGLSRLPEIEVESAGTIDEALRLIDHHTPGMILSDLDLPDRSGIELLMELNERRISVPLVFISAYLGDFQSRIPALANVETLEKPVPMEALRELVTSRLARSTQADVPDEGPAPFSLDEYLQLACMGRHSVSITVSRAAQPIGKIVVCEGDTWSARDALGVGEEAFSRLATASFLYSDTTVRCRTTRGARPERNIQEGRWQSLLMDAARLKDEAQAMGSQRPPPPPPLVDEVLTPPPQRPPPTDHRAFERLKEEGIDAILSRKHEVALDCFERANEIRPGDPQVEANIKRLAQLLS